MQHQELPIWTWHRMEVDYVGYWISARWWFSYIVQDIVRKLLVSDVMLLTLLYEYYDKCTD